MENQEFDFKTLVVYLEREYNLERDVVLSIIEESILRAARKNKNVTNDLRVTINRDDLSIHVYDTFVVSDEDSGIGFITTKTARRYGNGKKLIEGDVIEIEIPSKNLGRVCARESRMLILQKIKTAKNFNIVSNYKDRIGEIVNGVVSGTDKGNIIITVNGRTEMVIPKGERIPREKLNVGDSVSGVILGINEKQKYSPIVVSRSSNRFLEELMKREISELNDGTLEIMGISRDPGYRAKVSVKSNNNKVDPVGSCVGRRGGRINVITNELFGERIDVIRYNENVLEYVKEALSPAKLESIEFDQIDSDVINVTTSSDDYSKVIGKSGSNIKLASSLVGHKINVSKSLTTMTFDEQRIYAVKNMADMLSISLIEADKIVSAGFLNPEGIAHEDVISFIASTGLDEIVGRGVYAAAVEITKILSVQEDDN